MRMIMRARRIWCDWMHRGATSKSRSGYWKCSRCGIEINPWK